MITNRFNLPQEVYSALTKNRYSADDTSGIVTDYSTTSLIAPIQQTILKKRYPDANEEDAIDRYYSLFGHMMHSLLEEHGKDDSIVEKRFYKTVKDRVISGQVDNYKNMTITDYKTTSCYKIQKKSFDEWEEQLNIYCYLCRENDFYVKNIRIIAFIRDWHESSVYKEDYPQAPIVEIPINLWPAETQEKYVASRVEQLKQAEELDDIFLPECSNKERWMDDSKWAAMKEGGKRAVKLFDSPHEVEVWLHEQKDFRKFSIVERTGSPRRCLNYCSVSSKCTQHKQWLIDNGKVD